MFGFDVLRLIKEFGTRLPTGFLDGLFPERTCGEMAGEKCL